MKILVIGGTGKVAHALENQFSATDFDLTFLHRREFETDARMVILDPLDKKQLKIAVLEIKPDVIINSIAYNNVDGAEDDHSTAMLINAHLPEYLAGLCKLVDAHFITYGTDYIFDGKTGKYTEDSLPNPINYYGKSKLTGENMTRVTWEKSTVIRTNVVFGHNPHGHGDFVHWVKNQLETKEPVHIIEGQSCNPAYTGDIAYVTHKIMLSKNYGILHTGSSDYLNRYEMALIIADVYGHNPELIIPMPADSLKQKAKRPEYGGLDLFNTSTKLDFEFCSFRDGVEATRHLEKY